MLRVVLVLIVAATSAANCGAPLTSTRALGIPGAPGKPTAVESDAAPRTAALTSEQVRACLGLPAALVADGSSLFDATPDGGAQAPRAAPPLWGKHFQAVAPRAEGSAWAAMSADSWISLDVGPSRFEDRLGSALGWKGGPDGALWTLSERVEVDRGRDARVRGLSLGMSGPLVWATLPSPRRSYTLTLLFYAPHHDAAHNEEDQPLLRSLHELARPGESGALASALRCLDHTLWP